MIREYETDSGTRTHGIMDKVIELISDNNVSPADADILSSTMSNIKSKINFLMKTNEDLNKLLDKLSKECIRIEKKL